MTAPLVVKLGSSLVAPAGEPNDGLLHDIARVLSRARPCCIVSSGAIALGAARAGFAGRPQKLPAQQAASALGQAELQRAWSDALQANGVHAAQVLLTGAEIAERSSYVNVRNALQELFRLGAIPVLNENDATSTDEIGFSDNDVLAAQVAVLLQARRLVLLTSVEGVLDGGVLVRSGDDVVEASFGPTSPLGRGGIASKVAAARLAAAGGVPAVIAAPASLATLLDGGEAGTSFAARTNSEPAYKLWLRYGKPVRGRVTIDDGAVRALAEEGRSLLAVGVTGCSGGFRVGDGLEIVDGAGRVIARGISSVDATDLAATPAREVVHRDRLVLVDD